MILLATDGIFDNVPVSLLVDQITANMGSNNDTNGSVSAETSSTVSTSSGDELSLSSTEGDLFPSAPSLVTEDEYVRSCEDVAVRLQQCANSIALIARKLSQVRRERRHFQCQALQAHQSRFWG